MKNKNQDKYFNNSSEDKSFSAVNIYMNIFFVCLLVYGYFNISDFKEQRDKLIKSGDRVAINATFSEKRYDVKFKGETCVRFEGSNNSFFNPKNVKPGAKFEAIYVKDENGQKCIAEIFADGKTFLKARGMTPCIHFTRPDPALLSGRFPPPTYTVICL